MRFKAFLLFLILISFEAGAYIRFVNKTEDWKLVKSENGIQVYVKKTQGSDLNEFKGVTTINSKIEVIGEILRDVPSYTNWIPDCTEASIVSKTDRNNLVLHYAQKLPWPADNRDVVLSAKTEMDFKIGRFTITMESVKNKSVPVKNGFTRMAEMKGSYILEYIDREHTKVSYIVKANPGGALPSSIVNSSSQDIPFETLNGMKRCATQKRYIDAAAKSEEKNKIEDAVAKGYLKK